MKKLLLFLILFAPVPPLYSQTTQWSPWTKLSCYQGFTTSCINLGFVSSVNSYSWQVKIKNNYGRAVSFDMSWMVAGETVSIGRVTLSAGEEYKHTSRYFKSSVNLITCEVDKVCFSSNFLDCRNCYAVCDNGTPNQPDCGSPKATTTPAPSYAPPSQSTGSTYSTPQAQRTTTNYTPQTSRTEATTQALNQFSSSLIDAARILDAAKEQKRQQQEQQRRQDEARRAEDDRQKQEAEQQRQAYISSNSDYFMDVTTNMANNEMGLYMNYIEYQSRKVGFQFDRVFNNCTGINREKGSATSSQTYVRSAMMSLKKQAQKIIISLTFKYNPETGLKRILYISCERGDCSNINLTAILGSQSLTTGEGSTSITLGDNSVPPPVPGPVAGESSYEGFDVEGRIKEGNTARIYQTNGILCNCHSNAGQSPAEGWFQKAIDLGDTAAIVSLASIEEYDLENYAKAVVLYTRYFRLKPDTIWALKIANINYESKKLNDDTQAMVWYKIAADMGAKRALVKIGQIYQMGYGTPKDFKEALKWYILLGNRGDPNGYNWAGLLYNAGGNGLEKDWGVAVTWYLKAANMGYAPAMNNIALSYKTGGPNLERDKREAKEWARKACEADKQYCK